MGDHKTGNVILTRKLVDPLCQFQPVRLRDVIAVDVGDLLADQPCQLFQPGYTGDQGIDVQTSAEITGRQPRFSHTGDRPAGTEYHHFAQFRFVIHTDAVKNLSGSIPTVRNYCLSLPSLRAASKYS